MYPPPSSTLGLLLGLLAFYHLLLFVGVCTRASGRFALARCGVAATLRRGTQRFCTVRALIQMASGTTALFSTPLVVLWLNAGNFLLPALGQFPAVAAFGDEARFFEALFSANPAHVVRVACFCKPAKLLRAITG